MKKYLCRFWPLYLCTAVVVLLVGISGSQAVTAWAESRSIPRRQIVVIDAGHGGEDGGAVSCTGVPESRLNLEIALRLDALFHFLGYETKMIRTADISIYTEGKTIAAKKASDLRNRVILVNETDNSFLISIHQNLFADSRYSGAQVFYNPQGRELAEQLQTAFVSTLNPDSRRQCKPSSGIYLMEHIEKAGILVECGFLSNPEEEAKLRTGEYQQKICCVIAATAAEFFKNA